MLKSSSTIIQP